MKACSGRTQRKACWDKKGSEPVSRYRESPRDQLPLPSQATPAHAAVDAQARALTVPRNWLESTVKDLQRPPFKYHLDSRARVPDSASFEGGVKVFAGRLCLESRICAVRTRDSHPRSSMDF